MYIKYKKIREGIKSPIRENYSDAGLDLYYCGEETIFVKPNRSVMIESGLVFEVPHGYMLMGCNRGGNGSKGLDFGAHIIDPGYGGEVFVNLWNRSDKDIAIESGNKIIQVVMVPVIHFIPLKVPPETEFYKEVKVFSERGSGKLGSTGA